MKVTSTLPIGGQVFTFEVEDADEMSAMVNSITLASPRDTCTVCGAVGYDTKRLIAYRTKENYRYVKVRCECGAQSTLGQYRDGDGFFWKEYEVYEPEGGDGSKATGRPVENPNRGKDQGGRITPKALNKINEKLSVLQWSKDEVTSFLENNYSVSSLNALDLETARAVFTHLEQIVKQETPF